jgi:hypothetical protein
MRATVSAFFMAYGPLPIALIDMGEVVSLGKACFAPPNATALARALAGSLRFGNAGVVWNNHRPALPA